MHAQAINHLLKLTSVCTDLIEFGKTNFFKLSDKKVYHAFLAENMLNKKMTTYRLKRNHSVKNEWKVNLHLSFQPAQGCYWIWYCKQNMKPCKRPYHQCLKQQNVHLNKKRRPTNAANKYGQACIIQINPQKILRQTSTP